ncbi:LOW QUALITY PROTEIN: lysosomal thioesterase PPT2 [Sarcoramphus papa]
MGTPPGNGTPPKARDPLCNGDPPQGTPPSVRCNGDPHPSAQWGPPRMMGTLGWDPPPGPPRATGPPSRGRAAPHERLLLLLLPTGARGLTGGAAGGGAGGARRRPQTHGDRPMARPPGSLPGAWVRADAWALPVCSAHTDRRWGWGRDAWVPAGGGGGGSGSPDGWVLGGSEVRGIPRDTRGPAVRPWGSPGDAWVSPFPFPTPPPPPPPRSVTRPWGPDARVPRGSCGSRTPGSPVGPAAVGPGCLGPPAARAGTDVREGEGSREVNRERDAPCVARRGARAGGRGPGPGLPPPLLLLLLLLLLLVVPGGSYRPVVIVHGLFDSPSDFQHLRAFINESHPGTEVTVLDLFDRGASLRPLWLQGGFRRALAPIMANAADGVHLLGYSQGARGGLICRALLATMPDHNVRSFISLAAPSGQYGDTDYLKWLFPRHMKSNLYRLCYTPLGQGVSICNYWNDPHHHELYLNSSDFLALLNDERLHPNASDWKRNLLRIQSLVLIGGPDDGVITPWQSSLFGFYDANETVREMRAQEVSLLQDTFGLKTLEARGALGGCVVPGVGHTAWHSHRPVYERCIRPWLT